MQKSIVRKPTVIPATLLNRHPGELLKRVSVLGEHLIVEHGNFQIAVIIPIQDYQYFIKAEGNGVLSESKEVGA
ncbi:MAG: type II toxin-antitoxin system prevent-host-death family antitoxin [Anaerolineaceae bacterium]|nr:type II toxin-antitoxin system prevent-host-death family antitoxin [Anaerolineaceae bacterium]